MDLNLENLSIKAFTITYLLDKKQNKILLLKSIPGKQLEKSQWLGVGGKIEKGEDLIASAIREFKEETGLLIKDPILRGTWTWFEEPNSVATLYIFFASKFTGKLIPNNREGNLMWHSLTSLDRLKDFAPHQLQYLPSLLKNKKYFYSGLAIYSKTNELKLSISNL